MGEGRSFGIVSVVTPCLCLCGNLAGFVEAIPPSRCSEQAEYVWVRHGWVPQMLAVANAVQHALCSHRQVSYVLVGFPGQPESNMDLRSFVVSE